MDLIILAAGKGTRISNITKNEISKVMLPVNGYPFLAYIINQYTKKGFKKIILATSYCGDSIKNYFGNGKKYGINLSYSEENEPSGTGETLRHALSLPLSKNFLVINGDTFFDFDIAKLLFQHKIANSAVTLALARQEKSERYGVVNLDSKNIVQKFSEKAPSNDFVSGGAYLINKNKFITILSNFSSNTPLSLENEVWPCLVSKGEMSAVKFDKTFLDIGTPESYTSASSALKDYEW